jgi:uncharacterized lipoprotein YmbA
MNRLAPVHSAAALAWALTLGLAGCTLLEPSGVTPRSFVLTPLAVAPPTASSTRPAAFVLGISGVKVPGYLFKKSMAMRQEGNEIVYLEAAVWAERMDTGLQRVLAANLGTLLGTDQVRLSTWRPEEVSVEVYVNVERFDVDSHGDGVLTAWWRLVAPNGEKVLASGKFTSTHSGPSPEKDPRGAALSMSTLVADLSRELARAIQASSESNSVPQPVQSRK